MARTRRIVRSVTAEDPGLRTVLVARESLGALLALLEDAGWERVDFGGRGLAVGVKRGDGPRRSRPAALSLVMTDNIIRLDVRRGRRAA